MIKLKVINFKDSMLISDGKPKGYITLISLIVVGAVATAVTLSLILLGLGSSRSSLSNQQGSSANWLAHACAEEALQEIRNNSNYSGNDSMAFSTGSCSYTVTQGRGEERSIQAVGNEGSVTRRVEVSVSGIEPEIIINLWQEVADF